MNDIKKIKEEYNINIEVLEYANDLGMKLPEDFSKIKEIINIVRHISDFYTEGLKKKNCPYDVITTKKDHLINHIKNRYHTK